MPSAAEFLKQQNLATLRAAQLKTLARELGALTSGTKNQLITNILATCSLYAKLHQLISNKQQDYMTVTSLDPGISNFSYASIKLPLKTTETTTTTQGPLPILTKWTKFKLDSFNEPIETTRVTNQIYDALINNKVTAPTDLFVIERQRLRTNGSVWVPNSIMRVNILEHLIFAKLQDSSSSNSSRNESDNKSTRMYYVASSDPARMVRYWTATESIETGNSCNKRKSKNGSKLIRKKIVQKLLFSNDPKVELAAAQPKQPQLIRVGAEARSSFSIYDMLQLNEEVNGKRKDDDLCDSFLHALAWVRWFETYLRLKSSSS